jgi:hypothetical protein
MNRQVLSLLVVLLPSTLLAARAAGPAGAVLFMDFDAAEEPQARLFHGARRVGGRFGAALEFTNALQYAEVEFSRKLDGIDSVTVGGWFCPRRVGEQSFFFRGTPEVGPNGERFFRPREDWVNFVLGTDQHGFFLACANGNGRMPFPCVTLNDVPIDSWSQLALVKDSQGYQKFYRNGRLVHSDEHSAHAPAKLPFRDKADGEPVRLAMPMGGLVGEAWVVPRELTAGEIRRDFDRRRTSTTRPCRPSRWRCARWTRIRGRDSGKRRRPLRTGPGSASASWRASPRSSGPCRPRSRRWIPRSFPSRNVGVTSGGRCRSRSSPATGCRHTS